MAALCPWLHCSWLPAAHGSPLLIGPHCTPPVVTRPEQWPTPALSAERRHRNASRGGGQMRLNARPTTVSASMAPNTRLSRELPRLSPMTHSSSSPTVTGPNVLVVVPA